MVEGATRWYARGLALPESIVSASRDYLADNDDVSIWIDECCRMKADVRTKASDLYQSFSSWAKGRGQGVPSMRLFGERLAALPGISKVQSNGVRYVGIQLTSDEEERLTAMTTPNEPAWRRYANR